MVACRHTTLWLAALGGLCAASACAAPSAVGRAQALVRGHREADAAACLEDELRRRPGDVAARRLLVRVFALEGDLPHARAQTEALARWLPPGDPSPSIELGHAFELVHQYDDALEAYDEAARLAPAHPAGPREGGMRAARWGEAAVAAPRLEEAIRRGAADGEIWHTLGLVRLQLGEWASADTAYRAAAAAGAPEGWLGLATLAMLRDDPGAALDAYDHVVQRKPTFAAGHLGRAWALARLGRAAEAMHALDRAEALGAPASNVARQRAALSSARTQ